MTVIRVDATAKKLTAVWLALLATTALTAVLSETQYAESWATSVILLIASVKIALVIAYFMELKTAPRAWQAAYAIWLTMVTAIVVVGLAIS